MKHMVAITAFAVISLLSGCSSGGEGEESPLVVISKQVIGGVQSRRDEKGVSGFVQVTAEQLDNTKIPALQINLLSRKSSDFLKRVTQRNDAYPGIVSVWRATDGAQVILRNGVVIGTKGIGGDIRSSDADAIVRAVTNVRSGKGQRQYFVSDGGYGAQKITLSCDIDNLGRETTQVVHLTFQTVHLRETCIGGANDRLRIVNDYWVQPKSGIVRRSKQWVGPYSGYFELILLRN